MSKILSWTKRLFKFGVKAVVAGFLALVLINLWIIGSNKKYLYDNVQDIPANDVGLVLGTSKRVSSGNKNLYFTYRIKAAQQLFKAGKIKHILVSGDNRFHNYNEPRDLYQALVAAGVPESCITMDYAGFRTLDSVVRSKEVFQQNKITVISQEFHNSRAALVGRHYGIDVIAFNAKAPKRFDKPIYREYLARPKAMLDLYIFRTPPKFLGKKEPIFVCETSK